MNTAARNLLTGVRRTGAVAALAALALTIAGAGPLRAANETLNLATLYQKDLRALAMGNAFGPVAHSEAAMLYNPAGLVQFRDANTKLEASLALEAETGDFLTDTQDQFGGTSATKTQNYLEKYLDTSQLFRGQTFANIVGNYPDVYFGFGLANMLQQQYVFTFTDEDADGAAGPNDTLTIDFNELDINFVSLGFRAFQGKLLLGATYKDFIYETASQTSTFTEIVLDGVPEDFGNATAYSGSAYDVGLIYRSEWLSFLRPQWSLTAFNVGGVTLSKGSAPELDIPATYNLGLSLSPDVPVVEIIISMEAEDVTGAVTVRDADGVDHDRSTTQRAHFGAEIGFWRFDSGNNLISLRAGSNRGLTSYGAEINVFNGLRLVYTHYEDDLGHEDASDEHELDAYQVSLGFAF